MTRAVLLSLRPIRKLRVPFFLRKNGVETWSPGYTYSNTALKFEAAYVRCGIAGQAPESNARRETLLVAMHWPSEVVAGGLEDRAGDGREVGGDVMLEAVLADIAQQPLHVGNLHHAGPAEGV